MTATAAAAQPQEKSTMGIEPIIFPQQIPVVIITGEHDSGKTLFGLTIDPEHTLVFDTEDSSETYQNVANSSGQYQSLGYDRIDVPLEMMKRFPNQICSPKMVYCWWYEQIEKLEPHKYRVVVLDVANDIEIGLSDWVYDNPSYFNRTSEQYRKAAGLYWADVRNHWKAVLSQIAAKCEIFVATVHMGEEFKGGKPTGRRKPKGKSTLMELASLYLEMQRNVDAKGRKPRLPSAIVRKQRLSHMVVKDGVLRIDPVLPPRLPIATPAEIRDRMLNPTDYDKLKKDELAPEPEVTDDDRAAARLATAEAERDAEALRLERMQKQQEYQERQRAKQQTGKQPPPSPQQRTQQPLAPPQRQEHSPAQQPSQNGPAKAKPSESRTEADEDREVAINKLAMWRDYLFRAAGMESKTEKISMWQQILAKRGVKSALELSTPDIEKLTDRLRERCGEINQQKEAQHPTPFCSPEKFRDGNSPPDGGAAAFNES